MDTYGVDGAVRIGAGRESSGGGVGTTSGIITGARARRTALRDAGCDQLGVSLVQRRFAGSVSDTRGST